MYDAEGEVAGREGETDKEFTSRMVTDALKWVRSEDGRAAINLAGERAEQMSRELAEAQKVTMADLWHISISERLARKRIAALEAERDAACCDVGRWTLRAVQAEQERDRLREAVMEAVRCFQFGDASAHDRFWPMVVDLGIDPDAALDKEPQG